MPAADPGQCSWLSRCRLVQLTRMRGSMSAGVRRLSARKASKVWSADTAYTLQWQPAVTNLTLLNLGFGAGNTVMVHVACTALLCNCLLAEVSAAEGGSARQASHLNRLPGSAI